MTRKQILATEYVELRKTFDGDAFRGEAREMQIDFLTKEFTIRDLEDKINAVRCAIQEKERRQKVEAYYATEEGKKVSQSLTEQREKLIETWKTYKENVQVEINILLHNLLNEKWTSVLNIGYKYANIEIGMKPVSEKDRNFAFEFGHDFTIYLDTEYETDKFEMNYGTLGSFKLFEDTMRAEYLQGMGMVANNTEFLNELGQLLKEGIEKKYKIQNEIDVITKKLQYPF